MGTATTLTYAVSQALASISAAASSVDSAGAAASTDVPSATDDSDDILYKRAATTPCLVQPTGFNYNPSPDTASQFVADPYFSSVAASAPTPAGYTNTFKNLKASNSAYGYMGYTLMTAYDPVTCSKKCDKINGCMAFNIYFERDPSLIPDASACPNPSSVTQIKCAFWGGPVLDTNANNYGQYRSQFQVAISGSNGYVNTTITPPTGYAQPTDLGSATIIAPLDCSAHDSYMGAMIFTSGPYDVNLCEAACSAQTAYNLAYPPTTGHPLTCQFFTTYLLYKNGISVGQYCSLYSMYWSSTYATNVGSWYGTDHYTIGLSYSFANFTDSGSPYYACDVASATSSIKASSLQPFCSTLLGGASSVSTATSVTVPVATATTMITMTVSPVASNMRRNAQAGVVARAASSALSTPAALTKFLPSAITSACSLMVTPTTSIVFTTVVSTAPTVTTFVTATATVTAAAISSVSGTITSTITSVPSSTATSATTSATTSTTTSTSASTGSDLIGAALSLLGITPVSS